jgi:NAD(P)-dependent dehydrogenase (short-subunit alcohol dehydrogenase family)
MRDTTSQAGGGRFDGKVALVVGAGSDATMDRSVPTVGAAIALLLAREGCRVGVVARTPEKAANTAKLVRDEGAEAIPIAADVTIADDCRRAVAEIVDAYGKIDVLVNNLGVRLSGKGVLDVTDHEWDSVMDTNARGLVAVTRAAVPHMPPGSAIINTSSIAPIRPTNHSSIAYAASKGAVDAMTRLLALQLAPRKIRCNGVCPGNIWTPIAMAEVTSRGVDADFETARERRRLMVPLEEEGTGWDVAEAAAFLASAQSRWITGQTLILDGGGLLPAPSSGKPKPVA